MTNWIKEELAHRACEILVNKGTGPLLLRLATVDVRIACQTSDTDLIVAPSNNSATNITVPRSKRGNQRPNNVVCYLQIKEHKYVLKGFHNSKLYIKESARLDMTSFWSMTDIEKRHKTLP